MEKAAVTAVRMNMATRSARQNIPVRKKEYICLVIAVLLFGIYFFCRGQDLSIGGITAAQIETAVNAQEETKLVDFISQFPDILKSK